MNIPINEEWLALKNKYKNGDRFYSFAIIYNIEGFESFTSDENTILVRDNCIIGVRGDLIKLQY